MRRDRSAATLLVVLLGCGSVSNRPADAGSVDACSNCAIDAATDTLGPNDFDLEFDGTTLPSGLGWKFGSDCVPLGGVALTEAQAISTNGGLLHIDTTAPSTTVVDAYYHLDDRIDLTHGWVIEARLRVMAIESAPPAIAEAFGLLVTRGGEINTLWVGNSVMTTDTVSAPVDTSQFHVYRMRRAIGDANATVEVDGTPVLTSSPATEPPSANQIAFGDATCQARNGAVDLDYIRFTQP
jgi:hypothetical protein